MSFSKYIILLSSLLFIPRSDAQEIEVISYRGNDEASVIFKIVDSNVVLIIDKEVEKSPVSKAKRALLESGPLLYFKNGKGSVYKILSIRIDNSFELIDFEKINGKIKLKGSSSRTYYSVKPSGHISEIRKFWLSLQSQAPNANADE